MHAYRSIALGGLLILGLAVSPLPAQQSEAAGTNVSYLYKLSDFSGTVPYGDVRLHVDRRHDEIYASIGNSVRVFNHAGMEIFSFEHDRELGRIHGLAVDETGDILLLTYEPGTGADRRWSLRRSDYRGEPLERIEVRDLPPAFASFSPNLMLYRGGRFVLVSRSGLQVVILDRTGAFVEGHDLARLLEIEDTGVHEIFGFDVDRSGDMAFTIPVLFTVFVVSPDGTVRRFGAPGSAPGKFGIVAGVAVDDRGRYLVADKLRGVVMVFDSHFGFITEFGAEGERGHLVRPTDLALGNSGKFYVTQAANQGVSVLRLTSAGTELRSDGVDGREGGDRLNPTLITDRHGNQLENRTSGSVSSRFDSHE